MSCKINSDNSIELTRGDTLIATIAIKTSSGQTYVPEAGDTITFALKSAKMTLNKGAFVDAQPLVTKTIPNETLVLQLNPADTKQLLFGDYVYDIQIEHEGGVTDTFIANTAFKLMPEVH